MIVLTIGSIMLRILTMMTLMMILMITTVVRYEQHNRCLPQVSDVV